VGGIFVLRGEGDLVEMAERPYDSEDVLRTLLAKHPSLLAGEELSSGDEPLRWLLVAREASLPSDHDEGGRWSVDHLFLDQDAVPTLVEVKRSSDTRIRREVVGQMLDYAANAVVYWPAERLRATFEASCAAMGRDPEELIADLVLSEAQADAFWEKVQTNLQAGRVRLVFVADEIPRELRRIIEFLNVQMSPADVLGVEIRQYVGENLKTLVPRVVGQTAEAQQRKSRTAGGATRRSDWTWELFSSELGIREDRLAIGRELYERVARAIAERGLDWYPTFRKGYVAFQRAGGYNVVDIDLWWNRAPRLAIKLPRSPDELALESPYPQLETIWVAAEHEWGWHIPRLDAVPDVAAAIDVTRPYQPDTGPMILPS
jgi:hypothetical protein